MWGVITEGLILGEPVSTRRLTEWNRAPTIFRSSHVCCTFALVEVKFPTERSSAGADDSSIEFAMASRPDFSQLIADAAEDLFSSWASAMGMNATPPRRDRNGWDFILEFPASYSQTSLDTTPEGFSCRIQVKATTRTEHGLAIKLDNWERMAKEPIPWFCAVFQYEPDTSPPRLENVYLIHIDEPLISKALQRLRALRLDEAERLHKHTMSLTWDDIHLLAPPAAESLHKAILYHCGTNPRDYSRNKARIVSTVGYETNSQRLNVGLQFASKENAKNDMIDFALGIRESMRVASAESFGVRFGIESNRKDIGSGSLKIVHRPASNHNVKVIIEDINTHESARLPAEVRTASGMLRWLKPNEDKILAKGTCWQMIISEHSSCKFEFDLSEFSEDSKVSVETLGQCAKAYRLISQTDASQLSIRIEIDGSPVYRTGIGVSRKKSHMVPRYVQAIEDAYWIAKRFELDLSEPMPLEAAIEQADDLQWLRKFLSQSRPETISLYTDSPPPDFAGSGAAILVPMVRWLNSILYAVVVIYGIPSLSGRSHSGESIVTLRQATQRVIKEASISFDRGTPEFFTEQKRLAEKMLKAEGIHFIFSY